MWGALLASLFAALLFGGATLGEQSITHGYKSLYDDELRQRLKQQYGDKLTDDQIEALVRQYGDQVGGPWDVATWGNQINNAEVDAEVQKILNAQNVLGEAPEPKTLEELNQIAEEAKKEIDAEDRKLYDLYDASMNNTTSMLNTELANNAAMFGDYRNQVLTNEAMRQQAIAGSTRFELDRQQRNAIVRGASAAQRLVANINTQLGLQAQSAQQALDTSNALAQNLLAHRQAQQDTRNAYLNAQNQYNSNIAGVIRGGTERRYNYGQAAKQDAIADYEYARDARNTKADDYFRGDSFGRTQYGNGRKPNSYSGNAI